MSLFEEVMSLAVQMPQAERERLARALGVAVKASGPALPMASLAARPDPVAWRKAETGHAVLDTRSHDEGATGAAALAGLWSDAANLVSTPSADAPRVSQLPRGTPVVAHTDVCFALAAGDTATVQFFEAPPVEIRLATATYLELLNAAQDETQQARINRFVQPFAVLSLGPMASARAVELMREHSLADGLTPLAALIAATALAHEIPLVVRDVRPFRNIAGLAVCTLD